QITELLPNADGADTGNEFIELYNPGKVPVDLGGYYLQLGSSSKRHTFPDMAQLSAGDFISFSDTELKLSLPNSSGVAILLYAPDNTLLHETAPYDNPKEDNTWAFIDGVWQYTDKATPGSANILYIAPDE